MKGAPTQLDMRENTASSRQHAPRVVVDIDPGVNWTEGENTLLSLSDPLVEASPNPHMPRKSRPRRRSVTPTTWCDQFICSANILLRGA
jgi:hypothetical protein